MKRNLPSCFFFIYTIFSVLIASSQADRFAYAITDINKEGANWNFLRKIDLKTGAFSDVLLNGNDASSLAYDDATKKQMSEPFTHAKFGKTANAAFGTGVAAIAYDKRNNRLYYTPMFIDQLRYIDLKTMKVYFVTTSDNTGLQAKATDQSNIITRMAIGADGYGYALTNDGNHLLKFTTGKTISVTDIGGLIDAPENKNVSIHNSCSSFGGDMVADDDGNLFVFSNRKNVFKINIETKTATYLGAVSDLPSAYTINGAAVDNNNQVLITSAVDNSNIYTVDIKTLKAAVMPSSGPWRTSDLANSNLLSTRKPSSIMSLLKNSDEVDDGRVQLFPNPVTNNKFTLQFNLSDGNYTIEIKDVLGRQITQAVTNIRGKGQVKTLSLPTSASKGFYLVKVVDQNNKAVYSKKILVH